MTKSEALELELAARKMVEGTVVKWDEVIRWRYVQNMYKYANGNGWAFDEPRDYYELALDIVEGKPVWKHDKLWFTLFSGETHYLEVLGTDGQNFNGRGWCYAMSLASWNPPKPKTVMVEVLVEDARTFADVYEDVITGVHKGIAKACRKALENRK